MFKNIKSLIFLSTLLKITFVGSIAQMYLQLPWVAGNVYLLVLSSCFVNIAKNPIAVMG